MILAATLAGWCAVLALAAAWRPTHAGWRGAAAVAIALAVSGSTFWQTVAWAGWAGEAVPLAGPQVAFFSAWVLAVRPIVLRQLNRGALVANLIAASAAAAACGLAVDVGPALVEHMPQLNARACLLVGALLVGPAGLSWCLMVAPTRHLHWEYAAWYAAWLAMVAPR